MLQKYIFKISAFSILELIITIAIASILLLIVFPGMHEFYAKNIGSSEADKLKTALQFARSEAIKQNTNITFCKSKTFTDCDGDWKDGQIIKTSKNEVIRRFDPISSGDELTWQSSFSGEKDDYIIFTPTSSTAGQQGSFFYCPANSPENNMAVIIQETGVIRVSNRTSTGKMIVCEK